MLYKKFFDHLPDAALIFRGSDGSIVDANEAAAAAFGCKRGELLEKDFYSLHISEDVLSIVSGMDELSPPRVIETAHRSPGAAEMPAIVKLSCAVVNDEKIFFCTVRQRIGNIQLQKERSLAAKLALVEERERRRIAEGIHDHIGQSLAIARLKLGALKKAVPMESALSTLDDINALIEEAIKNTRSLTFELSPPILYDLGFGAAVEWLGEQLLEKNGVGFNLVNRLNPKSLGEELRIILFTTVRELFFNIVKHAGAKKVNILVQKLGDKVQVEVADDGAGFDTTLIGPGCRKNEGFGLFSIHERLEHLGGRLEILSEPGHGTRVTIEAPLTNRD